MNIKPIRLEYDRFMRKEFQDVGAIAHLEHGITRLEIPSAGFSIVLFAEHTINLEVAIDALVNHANTTGQSVEWKIFDWNSIPHLTETLLAHDFEADPAEACMTLLINTAPAVLKQIPSADVRIATHETLADADIVNRMVWGEMATTVSERVLPMWEDDPTSVSVHIAYVDGEPASYGRVEFPPNNPFAGIWAGATIPKYRKRGLYTALVASRLQEAQQRGYIYLTVDADPKTSMPILEKHGFQTIGYTTPYVYIPPEDDQESD